MTLGYDIIALKKTDGISLKFLVECKRYLKQKVGVEIIRSFSDVIKDENANKGIIFTTSYFTKDAVKLKNKKGYQLDLKNRIDVLDW